MWANWIIGQASADQRDGRPRSFHSALCQSDRHDLVNGSAQGVLYGLRTSGGRSIIHNTYGPAQRSDDNRDLGNTATNSANCIPDLGRVAASI